ncbi:MAG TPA: M48 family metallopeptidase [Thermoanaerobaculia bacterium]|nr:M48 family metallopeptidase [Thermoanaerobaculia bacterium]
MKFAAVLCLLAAVPLLAAPANRELPPGLIVPEAARPGPYFDAERATEAYLAVLSDEQRAKSDAYYEGGYWLQLWELLLYVAITGIVLFTGLSRRMRDLARRVTEKPFLVAMIYVALWLLVMYLLEWPFHLYTGFFREHQYGLSNQTFGAWLGDDLKGLGLSLFMLPPLIALLYLAVRRAGSSWWVWASAGVVVVSVFMGIIAPVLISPIFNKYTPLPPGQIRDEVLSLARANRIPAKDVYVVDQSRQTTRVSANVQGMFGTTRISLNDNLLNRTSLEEIRLVMAHEMGHYVLHHTQRLLIYMGLVFTIALFVVHKTFDRALARWGTRWGVSDRTDPAGLPLAILILVTFMTLMSPLISTIVRQAEAEADAFAISAAREPHGFATVALRLSTYRKLKPTPLEEAIFYDHPSGYDRVHRAMTWLAENQPKQ